MTISNRIILTKYTCLSLQFTSLFGNQKLQLTSKKKQQNQDTNMIAATSMSDISKPCDTKRLYTIKRKHPNAGIEFFKNSKKFAHIKKKSKTLIV